ncbi:MAG: sugar transferase [Rhodobacterales bacterium]|nr:sugar transferase [Rhodobacterales bacterium]
MAQRRKTRSMIKRLFDIGAVVATLPVAGPILLVAAVAIRAESKGSPIFKQERVGMDGRKFQVYKLRTMVDNAENIGAGLYAVKDDPRFTNVGLFLRRVSLDELPQIVNILKGDMSIVGPRPQLEMVTSQYPEQFGRILKVRPGLTGLSQINGRNDIPRSTRMAYDEDYATNWTLRGDAKILAKTAGVVVTGEGQRNDQSAADVEK